MVTSFNGLGLNFTNDQIEMLRSDESSKAFGVPADHLDGHAFHTYTLTSGDGSVEFEFKHNVCGRSTYAEGAVDGAVFLSRRIEAGDPKKVYSMIDVLAA